MCSSNWFCGKCGRRNCGEDVFCIQCLTVGPQFVEDILSTPVMPIMDNMTLENYIVLIPEGGDLNA